MIFLLNTILLILEIFLLIATMLFATFGLYTELAGDVGAERLLEILHIPLNPWQVIIIGLVCLALLSVCHFARTKLT